jgi:hypothetical protein
MDPPVGDLAQPPGQMRLQPIPAREAVPGDGVALDIADAALVLALLSSPELQFVGTRERA